MVRKLSRLWAHQRGGGIHRGEMAQTDNRLSQQAERSEYILIWRHRTIPRCPAHSPPPHPPLTRYTAPSIPRSNKPGAARGQGPVPGAPRRYPPKADSAHLHNTELGFLVSALRGGGWQCGREHDSKDSG